MKVLDLFSGIGGFSVGLERAGMETTAFVEIDPYARAVLRKHWPRVPVFDDVRHIGKELLDLFSIEVDVVCGGFPCQDISLAGAGAGIEGSRSGLWREYARIIEEVRPRWAIIENVSALRARGLDTVLGSLAAIGYDAEWHCIPASAVGAPHRRDRIWIVAYPNSSGREKRERDVAASGHGGPAATGGCIGTAGAVADADSTGLEVPWNGGGLRGEEGPRIQPALARRSWWAVEPDVGGGSDGFPAWLVRFVGWGLTYGESQRSVEALRELWRPDVAEALWRAVGGLDRFLQAQVLFAVVRQYQKNPDQARILMASQEALEGLVRSVWRAAETGRASRRSRQGEQRTGKHPDAVQVVPRLPACDGETPWACSGWEDGVPRVAHGVAARVDRLRCLGNAVVPQIPEAIGRAIMAAEATEYD